MASRLLHVVAALTTVTLLCAVAVGQQNDSNLGGWHPDCSTTNNYTDKSAYKKNLDQLLVELPGKARGNGWFYKGMVGAGADEVFGLIMCYADYNATQCLDCLTRAPKGRITTMCPGSRNVSAMFDACMLRYSDTPISATADLNYLYRVRMYTIFPDVVVNLSSDKVQTAWVPLMSKLTGDVTASPLRISNSSTPFSGSEEMFGLAQCTRDLDASECSSCISNYIKKMEELLSWYDTDHTKGGAIKGYSCYLRYQVHALNITLPPPLPPQTSPPGPSSSSKNKRTALVISLSIGAASSIVIVLGLLTMWLRRRKQRELLQKGNLLDDEDEPDMEDDEFEKGTGPKRFRYGELAIATDNFSDKHKLGEGGFGSVYRGFLQEMNLHVAIKRVSKSSRQGRKEYASEVKVKSRLRHRNLVQLIGWCHGGGDLLLVYELMPNGSLDKHLYRATATNNDDSVVVLPWQLRHEIVLGLGSALLYLHEEWEQCVVHRDIKPSNVMLDASFHARLGDFGLARLVDHDRGSHTTVLVGTMGYIDPECTITGRFNKESDIYSLGVLLLEVACGRRPVVVLANDTVVHLAQRVSELHERGLLLHAADPRLNGEFDPQEMERMLLVGLWCTQHDRSLRPSIRQVVSALRFEAPPPSLPERRRKPVATTSVPAVPFGLFNSVPSLPLPGDDTTRTGSTTMYLSLSITAS